MNAEVSHTSSLEAERNGKYEPNSLNNDNLRQHLQHLTKIGTKTYSCPSYLYTVKVQVSLYNTSQI